jgi:[CysO sulfur-carrier protein]-S-L-cysteine hydrolase
MVPPVRIFDLDLEPSIIHEIAAHGERDFPIEACGSVLARSGRSELVRCVPMRNVQDRYHQRDPEAFPRDGRDAFRIDELERIRMLERADAEGLVERVLYHSHCDAGAYFSPEDRAMAVQQGVELMPGIVHIVVSIRGGKRSDMAAFKYDAERQSFNEVRIPLKEAEYALPDVELRAMEGREAARPIRPCGGLLAPRRVTADERARISNATDRVSVRIDNPESIRDLRRLELGLLSPLSGFLRAVEARSIEQSGRLLSGTPWRTPVLLEISAKKSAVLPAQGSLVELVDADGRQLAAMGLTEVLRVGKDTVRLAGPVYVYETGPIRDAAETRADLLRRGMKRVLAIGPEFQVKLAAAAIDLSEFDGVLSAFPIERLENVYELPLVGRDPWLDAVMAQNMGATHLWVEDPLLIRTIEESLAIEPWRPDRPEIAQHALSARDVRILEADDE